MLYIYFVLFDQMYSYKDYPRVGNRSVAHPHSSVGTTFTFGVVQVTGSNLTSSVSFIETLARASLEKQNISPWFPR